MWDKKVVYFVCILKHALFVESLAVNRGIPLLALLTLMGLCVLNSTKEQTQLIYIVISSDTRYIA